MLYPLQASTICSTSQSTRFVARTSAADSVIEQIDKFGVVHMELERPAVVIIFLKLVDLDQGIKPFSGPDDLKFFSLSLLFSTVVFSTAPVADR